MFIRRLSTVSGIADDTVPLPQNALFVCRKATMGAYDFFGNIVLKALRGVNQAQQSPVFLPATTNPPLQTVRLSWVIDDLSSLRIHSLLNHQGYIQAAQIILLFWLLFLS